jgi:uncharacterized protein YabE (DUF348 family)
MFKFGLKKDNSLVLWLLVGLILIISASPAWAFLFPQEKKVTLQRLETRKNFTTTSSSIGEFLRENSIEVGPRDRVIPGLDQKLSPEEENLIKIFPSRSIILQDGNQPPKEISTTHQTVKEALVEAQIEIGNLDQIEPNPDYPIEEDLWITITRIKKQEEVEQLEIPFKAVTKKDPGLELGKAKTIQEGKKGQEQITYQVTYHNGEEVSREEVSREVLEEPQEQIVAQGVKASVGRTQEGLASWYAWTGTLACASTTFPKGTRLRVTSLENGKQVTVVVNDYGPQPHTGKIIDLDKVAFEKLAPTWKGVVRVKIEELL